MNCNARIALVVAAIVAAGVLVAVLSSRGSGGSAAKTHSFTLEVKDRKPVGGIKKLPVKQGDRVKLVVRSDVAGDAHVHGYVQVGALILGHVAGLVLTHDRALVLYRRAHLAVRSQYWMLAVMIGFTGLGLWLLSEANA